jgi:hypothetical protein
LARQFWQSLRLAMALLDLPDVAVDPLVATVFSHLAEARTMRHSTILLALVAAWGFAPSVARAQPGAWGPQMQMQGPGQATYFQPEGADPGLMSSMPAAPPPPPLEQYYAPAEDRTCYGAGCGQCGDCCHRHDVFGSIEALIWWGQGSITPPLVTTSPPGTDRDDAGVIGAPGTEILFGREYLGDNVQAGGRVTAGIWLDPTHDVALAGRFYGLGGDASRFFRESDGDLTLARPFFNLNTGENDALLVAFDDPVLGDIVDGSITAKYLNQNFIVAESYLQIMMHRECRRRIDLIGGYQFTRQDDLLQINSTSIVTEQGGTLPEGTQFDIFDRFATQNKFHGGTIGVRSKVAHGCWSLDSIAKVALGVNHQFVQIDGSTLLTFPPGPGIGVEGGLLAQQSNIGEYDRYRFCAIPEFTLNLTHHITCNCSLHVGYTLIFWSNMVTSGPQIDTGIDLSQLAGPAGTRPAFRFEDQTYWLQGINLGLNWDF